MRVDQPMDSKAEYTDYDEDEDDNDDEDESYSSEKHKPKCKIISSKRKDKFIK